MKFSVKYALLLLIAGMMTACELPGWLKSMRKSTMEKRYGTTASDTDKIPEWQEEVREYEKQINQVINAGIKAGKLYRKIGESYGILQSYEQCAENLEKAVSYGENNHEVQYFLGLCYGNLARSKNWDYETALKAEKALLSSLAFRSDYDKARYELALVYFYGFGRNNPYRVNADILTVSQIEARSHAIRLMREVRTAVPDEPRVYFALANMYQIMGESEQALRSMNSVIPLLEKLYPGKYQEREDYQSAIRNRNLLQGSPGE